MAFLETSVARIAYDIIGDGDRNLILVNGHMRTRSDFRLMARFFSERNFKVLIFDNRSSGETTHTDSVNLENMSEDITQLALALNLPTYSLLGISMGGLISLRHALNHPKNIEKLILVSSTAKTSWITSSNPESWGTDIPQISEKMKSYVAPDFAQKNRLLIQAMAKQILYEIQNGDYLAKAKMQRKIVAHTDLTSEIGVLQMPTLILHGELDQIISASAAEELKNLIPNSELEIVSGIGHLFLAENPRVLYDRVLQFIER